MLCNLFFGFCFCFFFLVQHLPTVLTQKSSTGKEDENSGQFNVILLGLYYSEKSPLSFLKYVFLLHPPLSVALFSCLNVGSDQRSVLGPLTCSLDFSIILQNHIQLPTRHLLLEVVQILTYTKLSLDHSPHGPIHIAQDKNCGAIPKSSLSFIIFFQIVS